METPILLAAQPGIRRDGTRLQNLNYTDGAWVRFNENGNPTKMGGYLSLSSTLSGTSRGLHSASITGVDYIHTGSNDDVQLVQMNRRTGHIDVMQRTPEGLQINDNYVWTFDCMFDVINPVDSTGGSWKIIAHAAPNLVDIDSSVRGGIYIGDLNDAAPLVPIMEGQPGQEVPFRVSGGICCVHPFLFWFDNDGRLGWSVSNKPSNVTDTFTTGTNVPAGEVRPTGKKIIAGRSIKGTGVPGGLFWSLDTLLRASYVGGNSTWDFDDVATIEILSSKSVVEYNGSFYWIGARRFIVFAGGVRDVPNTFNKNWFFNNLTRGHEGKIFGWTVPAHGEIWWAAPMFGATEPNHAIVLNVVTGNWYDTPLPGLGRTAALSSTSTYHYPILAEPRDPDTLTAKLWQHERGTDCIDGPSVTAVRSFYTTSDITLLRGDKPSSQSVNVLEIEPDFVQRQAMSVTVYGNANARAPTQVGEPVKFDAPGDGVPAAFQTVELRDEHRQMRFRFESNTVGGDYEAGATYAHIKPTGGRKSE